MTWSIVARDASGAFGVAIASRFFAVGALCPHARAGVGALATQRWSTRSTASPASRCSRTARPPPRSSPNLTTGRPRPRPPPGSRRSTRAAGPPRTPATHASTGAGTSPGPATRSPATCSPAPASSTTPRPRTSAPPTCPSPNGCSPRSTPATPAGGDKRGKQAAALLIVTTEDYPFLTLRVDDHEEPFVELRRLYDKSLERFQPFTACLPRKSSPAGMTDRAVIEREVERFHAERVRRGAASR
jgi:hypothetical protein